MRNKLFKSKNVTMPLMISTMTNNLKLMKKIPTQKRKKTQRMSQIYLSNLATRAILNMRKQAQPKMKITTRKCCQNWSLFTKQFNKPMEKLTTCQ